MWVYAHTDLADLYRDRLTLRQVYVRLQALPLDAPLRAVIAAEQERAEAEQKERDLRDVLAQFQPPKEG